MRYVENMVSCESDISHATHIACQLSSTKCSYITQKWKIFIYVIKRDVAQTLLCVLQNVPIVAYCWVLKANL
jgi:hypothetical protein